MSGASSRPSVSTSRGQPLGRQGQREDEHHCPEHAAQDEHHCQHAAHTRLQEIAGARPREHPLHRPLQGTVEATGAPEQADDTDDGAGPAAVGETVDGDHGHITDGVELIDQRAHELVAQLAALHEHTQKAHEEQQCRHHGEEREVGEPG